MSEHGGTESIPTSGSQTSASQASASSRSDDSLPDDSRPGGVLSPAYRWTTIGMCSLVFLVAFEALAVTTVMPVISRQLHGQSLYALAFAAPIAVGVIGTVAAGNWSDRSGPKRVLMLSVALFAVGLIVAGTAQSMMILILGRSLYGLAGGAMTVALYVVVARAYPPALHPKIFAGFSAAWVVPSLIGPFIAGLVAQFLSWHWVFLGVVVLVFAAMGLVWRILPRIALGHSGGGARWNLRRMGWSVLAAAGVFALSLSAELPVAVSWPAAVGAAALVVLFLRPLVPIGTFRAARGMPAGILVLLLAGGAFAAAETYVPYFLTTSYGLEPATAGLALTGGALAWSAGSFTQSRLDMRLSSRACVRIGLSLIGIAVLGLLAMAVLRLAPGVAFAVWIFAGGGMGTMLPRLNTVILGGSAPSEQGFTSSAMTIANSMGNSIAVAFAGVAFATLAPFGTSAVIGCFILAAVIWAIAFAVGGRATFKASGT
jgi:MFS family permease